MTLKDDNTIYRLEQENDRLRAQRDNREMLFEMAKKDVEKLIAQRDQLLAALNALVSRLDAVHANEDYKSVWVVNQIHAGPYQGPNYTNELEHARAAIAETRDAE